MAKQIIWSPLAKEGLRSILLSSQQNTETRIKARFYTHSSRMRSTALL